MLFSGKAIKYGDNINTDVIIPGKYTKTLDFNILANHVMEDLDPNFKKKIIPGDFIVAGENFGCGSSREQAPIALKYVGVAGILAKSFARIFYRNSINIGMPLIECDTDLVRDNDILEINLEKGYLKNQTLDTIIPFVPLPKIMVEILFEGGLECYMKNHGKYEIL